MRPVVLVTTLLALATISGCGTQDLHGRTTNGDLGQTVWQLDDGLCGSGLFGSVCDLNQHVAVGASPLVEIHATHGVDLTHATLMGSDNVTISSMTVESDDNGSYLEANVGSGVAGVADITVLDASGHEIDRAHLTFVTAATLACGALSSASERSLSFPGLTSAPVTMTMAAMTTSASTTLACRANDASGNALLTVSAIRWSVATGAIGTIDVSSDDVLGTSPAFGATARVVTMGTGSGTIHAALGSATADVAITFH